MEVNLKTMTKEDLEKLYDDIYQELELRQKERRAELVRIFCKAYNELKDEFPFVELYAERYCEHCDEEFEIDILDFFDHITPDDFC